MSVYGQLRGTGRLTVMGKRSGKFNFTFTSDSHDTFLQFRDMLGRKTLFMEIHDSSLTAWDMIQNEKGVATTLPCRSQRWVNNPFVARG